MVTLRPIRLVVSQIPEGADVSSQRAAATLRVIPAGGITIDLNGPMAGPRTEGLQPPAAHCATRPPTRVPFGAVFSWSPGVGLLGVGDAPDGVEAALQAELEADTQWLADNGFESVSCLSFHLGFTSEEEMRILHYGWAVPEKPPPAALFEEDRNLIHIPRASVAALRSDTPTADSVISRSERVHEVAHADQLERLGPIADRHDRNMRELEAYAAQAQWISHWLETNSGAPDDVRAELDRYRIAILAFSMVGYTEPPDY